MVTSLRNPEQEPETHIVKMKINGIIFYTGKFYALYFMNFLKYSALFLGILGYSDLLSAEEEFKSCDEARFNIQERNVHRDLKRRKQPFKEINTTSFESSFSCHRTENLPKNQYPEELSIISYDMSYLYLSPEELLSIFQEQGVSPHFFIDLYGNIIQIVSLKNQTRLLGKSEWHGYEKVSNDGIPSLDPTSITIILEGCPCLNEKEWNACNTPSTIQDKPLSQIIPGSTCGLTCQQIKSYIQSVKNPIKYNNKYFFGLSKEQENAFINLVQILSNQFGIKTKNIISISQAHPSLERGYPLSTHIQEVVQDLITKKMSFRPPF